MRLQRRMSVCWAEAPDGREQIRQDRGKIPTDAVPVLEARWQATFDRNITHEEMNALPLAELYDKMEELGFRRVTIKRTDA